MYAMQTLTINSISMSTMKLLLNATAGFLLRLSVNRWAGLRPGQKGCCSVLTGTNVIFIKKIDFRGFDSIGFFAYRQKDDLSFCLFYF